MFSGLWICQPDPWISQPLSNTPNHNWVPGSFSLRVLHRVTVLGQFPMSPAAFRGAAPWLARPVNPLPPLPGNEKLLENRQMWPGRWSFSKIAKQREFVLQQLQTVCITSCRLVPTNRGSWVFQARTDIPKHPRQIPLRHLISWRSFRVVNLRALFQGSRTGSGTSGRPARSGLSPLPPLLHLPVLVSPLHPDAALLLL